MRGTEAAVHHRPVQSALARARGTARAAVAVAAVIGALSWSAPAASQPAPAASQAPPAAPPPAAAGHPQAAPPPPPGYGPPGYGMPAHYGYPPPPGGPPWWYAPPPSTSPEVYDQYIRAAEERLDAAKERDDEQEIKRLKEELKALKRARKEAEHATTQRRSTGMMVGGIVLSSVGGVGIITGSVLAVTGAFSNGSDKDEIYAGGLVALTFGLVCVGAGIPLAVVGGKRVPKEFAASPVLLIGPQSAGLRWQF